MAERIVDLVAEKYGDTSDRAFKSCFTREIPLAGADFKSYEEVLKYQDEMEKLAESTGLTAYYGRYLVANYGNQSDEIINAMKGYNDDANVALVRAELQFCLRNELCMKPMDFFNRRTGRLYFNIKSIKPALDAVLADFAKFYEWDATQIGEEKAIVLQAIVDVSEFE
jgi:glycerol-3-phosphate dehydrogenase